MKYTLGITYSTFFEEVPGDLEILFKEKCKNKFNAIATVDETNEDDRHVAGNMNVSLESKNKSESVIGLVEKFINQNSLGGECWALTDEAGQLLITEETIEFK